MRNLKAFERKSLCILGYELAFVGFFKIKIFMGVSIKCTV